MPLTLVAGDASGAEKDKDNHKHRDNRSRHLGAGCKDGYGECHGFRDEGRDVNDEAP